MQTPSRSPPTLQQIQNQNEQLKAALLRLQQQQAHRLQQNQKQPDSNNAQFQRRVDSNGKRIRQLQSLLAAQEEVIREYKQRFQQFQSNLLNVMKLDKDIHARLVNPQSSSALQANVKNVLLALNGKAPYDKLIKMIESIKV